MRRTSVVIAIAWAIVACGGSDGGAGDSGSSAEAGPLDRAETCEAHDDLWVEYAESLEAADAWSDARWSAEYADLAERTTDLSLADEFARLAQLLRDPESEVPLDFVNERCDTSP